MLEIQFDPLIPTIDLDPILDYIDQRKALVYVPHKDDNIDGKYVAIRDISYDYKRGHVCDSRGGMVHGVWCGRLIRFDDTYYFTKYTPITDEEIDELVNSN